MCKNQYIDIGVVDFLNAIISTEIPAILSFLVKNTKDLVAISLRCEVMFL